MSARHRLKIPAAILFAVFFTAAASAESPDDPIASIRATYAQIQEKIAVAVKEAEAGSPPDIYATEVFVNRHNGSWRATGTYSKKTVFWYTDQPAFAGDEPGGELSVLAKIEIEEIAGARTFYREFLFDKGRLVFAWLKEPDNAGQTGERRYYFQDGTLIRYMEGKEILASIPATTGLESEVRRLQEQFLSTF